MQWYFNDQEISGGDNYMITFDGTYATLFIASCVMDDMGEYKCVFENSAGRDETTGKVTVKPVSKNYFLFQFNHKRFALTKPRKYFLLIQNRNNKRDIHKFTPCEPFKVKLEKKLITLNFFIHSFLS